MHSWVLVFCFFITMAVWYWFVFFKLQKVVSVMLPPVDNIYRPGSFYYSFVVMLHVLCVFQWVYILVLVVRQSVADMFLIDWEPSKSKSKSLTYRTLDVILSLKHYSIRQ
jgi:hypothetical protein